MSEAFEAYLLNSPLSFGIISAYYQAVKPTLESDAQTLLTDFDHTLLAIIISIVAVILLIVILLLFLFYQHNNLKLSIAILIFVLALLILSVIAAIVYTSVSLTYKHLIAAIGNLPQQLLDLVPQNIDPTNLPPNLVNVVNSITSMYDQISAVIL